MTRKTSQNILDRHFRSRVILDTAEASTTLRDFARCLAEVGWR